MVGSFTLNLVLVPGSFSIVIITMNRYSYSNYFIFYRAGR